MEFEIVYWHWWSLALVLLTLELGISSCFYLLMLAIVGFITGTLQYLAPFSDSLMQVGFFSVVSIIGAILMTTSFDAKKCNATSDSPLLNKRGEQLIGMVFALQEPIINGLGKIKAFDSFWVVKGEDCDIDNKVKITGVNGTVLLVEKAG
jgi:membrane protein implicated in regulation of membrane protease activity